MKAELITVGDELLIGQVVDTNSSWMAAQLNDIGVEVKRRVAVADAIEDIQAALAEALSRVELVLITGGLGPTNDDLTRDALAEYFQCGQSLNRDILNTIEQRFKIRGIPMPEMNKRMAMVPDKAKVVPNDWGTAPGLLFESSSTTVIALPGVPSEMKGIMTDYVLPSLKSRASSAIVHRTIQTYGLPESSLAERIADWEAALPGSMSLAYLPAYGTVRLRLTARGKDRKRLIESMDRQIELLKPLIEQNIFSLDDRSLEEIIGDALLSKNQSLSTAESCTGGAISKQMVRVAGSSAYFKGSVVAYSYEAKEQLLGVSMDIINQHGAVSEQCVVAMSNGARERFQSDYAIATSGIAGPAGGTPQKPVGTIWMAVSGPQGVVTKCLQFGKQREQNIERSVSAALQLLLQIISDSKSQ